MERTVTDIPEMYSEMMILMRMRGVKEESRNGPVLTLPEPLTVTVRNPLIRANVDPLRRCNPFFHLMEFVWMMSGERKVKWIAQFNKKMWDFAEDDGELHAAYGWRWRRHFFNDQIYKVVEMLKEEPATRRAVIGMWDASLDIHGGKRDLPCNTHIYLRITEGALDMTVCNRSNDVIWGMTGANAVHMTLLQELIANAIEMPVGNYRVFTNNAHIYLDLPNVEEMLCTSHVTHIDYTNWVHVPLLSPGESLSSFLTDCVYMVDGGGPFTSRWIDQVAIPVYELWYNRQDANKVLDTEWAQACNQWLRR